MSLFNHMGLWGIAITMMLAFIVKYFAVEYILRTKSVETMTAQKGWAGILNITTGIHAALTYVILFPFTDHYAAVFLMIAAAVIEYVLGYWRAKHRLPSVTQQKLLQVYNATGLLQKLGYGGITALALKYFSSKFGL